MQMPGRNYEQANSSYRYGFNGKENDNEIKGEGNQQDYGMRIYDVRIGRFLSTDPLTKSFSYYSPYQFAGNSPIMSLDLDGEEEFPAAIKYGIKSMKLISSISNKTVIIGVGVNAQAGLGYVSGSYKRSYSLAADPTGNLAITTTYMGFIDLFHTFGGKSYDFMGTGNEGGSDDNSFFLGLSLGFGGSVGYFNLPSVGNLSGIFQETDISSIGGSTIYTDPTNSDNFLGASLSAGKSFGLGIGSGKTNTEVFAFTEQDIEQYIGALKSGIKDMAKLKAANKEQNLKFEWKYVKNENGSTTLTLNIINRNQNNENFTLMTYDALQYKKKDDNYTRTTRVEETETKE